MATAGHRAPIGTAVVSVLSRVADELLPPAVELADVFAQVGYQPTPKQAEFHNATEFDVLFGGAQGPGKTTALVLHAYAMAMIWPGIRIAIIRRSYPELEESITPVLVRYGYFEEQGARYHQNLRELRFGNRSIVRLVYLENMIDASRRQGGEYQALMFDERAQIMPGVAEVLINERLRARVGSGVPVLGVRSTSNPGGASHNDVKARFIDATDYGKHTYVDPQGRTVRFIPAKVADNPHVDPEYARRLDAIADPHRRAAMRDGDWSVPEGAVFSEWRRDRHVVPTFPLPADWLRYCGVDWGYTAPWAVIWAAEDEDGRVYVYRECYATEVGESEQARRILAAEAKGEAPTRVGDPSMRARRGEAMSIADAYQAEGVHLRPANNDRIGGWSRVHAYLAEAPACRHHREKGWETCPLLHVLDGAAPNLVRTLPALPRNPFRPEDVDTHSDDHVADALRYLLMELGNVPQFPVFDEPVAPEEGGRPLLDELGAFVYPQQQTENLGPFVRRRGSSWL